MTKLCAMVRQNETDLLKATGFPAGAHGKEPVCQCRRLKRCGFDPQEEGMATHSNILAWRIPWTEEPGGLQSMGSKELDTTEVT